LNQETYEKYRKGGHYQKVINNIKLLAETKKRLKSITPIIDVQFIVFSHNEHEIPETKKFYEYGADLVSVMRNCLMLHSTIKESLKLLPKTEGYNRWEGQYVIHENGTVSKIPLKFCPFFYRQIAINPNGDVFPCCYPSHIDKYKFGNFFKTGFMDIWNNSQYQSARSLNSGKLCHNACGICFSDKWFEPGELQN
jgi:radical SAM protein with 4Fe4S-binding SPASM domain